jgi:hypothetical protein
MDKIDELKRRLQRIAWEQAPKILEESGYNETEKYYALRKYEMQFAIYQHLKMTYGLE